MEWSLRRQDAGGTFVVAVFDSGREASAALAAHQQNASSTPDNSPAGTKLVFNLDPTYVSDEPFDPQRFRDRINGFPVDLSNVTLTIRLG